MPQQCHYNSSAITRVQPLPINVTALASQQTDSSALGPQTVSLIGGVGEVVVLLFLLIGFKGGATTSHESRNLIRKCRAAPTAGRVGLRRGLGAYGPPAALAAPPPQEGINVPATLHQGLSS